jgi:hypothetical protein
VKHDGESKRRDYIALVVPQPTQLHFKQCAKCRKRQDRYGPERYITRPSKDIYHVNVILCRTCLTGNKSLRNTSERFWPSHQLWAMRVQEGEEMDEWVAPAEPSLKSILEVLGKVHKKEDVGGKL